MRFLGSKFTQNALAADPDGEAKALPRSLADFRGPLSGRGKGKEGKGRRERGKGYWGRERGREGKGRGGRERGRRREREGRGSSRHWR